MKKLLITGAHSYVGDSVAATLRDTWEVATLDMHGKSWKQADFSGYDAIFHVAGIVHLTGEKAKQAESLYHQVNTTLAIETAKKAKAEGVGQFIFMSSASVYGENGSLTNPKVITPQTPLAPVNAYGISKLNAETGLQELEDETFRVAILRPPMIYGKNCRGNYQTLSKLARKLPVFPKVNNQRSMLYIGNLAEFVRLVLENNDRGIFCPQDSELVNTSQMVSLIAEAHGKKMILVPGTLWALKGLSKLTPLVDKAFGSLSYAPELSQYPQNYCLWDLAQAIQETER